MNQPPVIDPPSVQQKAFVGFASPYSVLFTLRTCTWGPEPSVPKANARIACLINNVNALSGPDQPSFVILPGDLTSVGCAFDADLVLGKGFCDQLTAPWYTITGNHDFAPNWEIAARYLGKEDYHDGSFETLPFGRVFGSEGHRFSFTTEGNHFIGFTLRDGDPDGSLDWLEAEMDGLSSSWLTMGCIRLERQGP